MTDDKQKVLVIEDYSSDIRKYRSALGDKVDLPIVDISGCINCVDKEASLKNIETCLRETPYAVIFMDGQLYLDLGSPCDGAILVRRIREGVYGALNQDTEIQNISIACALSGTRKDCDKYSLANRNASGAMVDPIQYAKKMLGI
jgi:hypothetical protein